MLAIGVRVGERACFYLEAVQTKLSYLLQLDSVVINVPNA